MRLKNIKLASQLKRPDLYYCQSPTLTKSKVANFILPHGGEIKSDKVKMSTFEFEVKK